MGKKKEILQTVNEISQELQSIRAKLDALGNNIQHSAEENILSRGDIMKKYNISVATLWKRMRDGSIPFFKIGRRVYFYDNEVKDAIKINKNN